MNLYLHTTERLEHEQNPKYDCLRYSARRDKKLMVTIDYCLRPSGNHDHFVLESEPAGYHSKFTIDQLFHLNITFEHLFSWYTSVDLIEDYQYYVNTRDEKVASKEVFRCIQPWFGARCQYRFTSGTMGNFVYYVNRIIKDRLNAEQNPVKDDSTCYTHLSCKDHGVPVCLQWTQICDGRIDCIDSEEDEKFCYLLEVNECQPNEYRCHNGLCISKVFVSDAAAECLDQSDILIRSTCKDTQDALVSYLWREHGRRPDGKSFVCADRQSTREFDNFDSTLHRPVLAKLNVSDSLATDCWIVMVCLTKMMDQINGIVCNQFIRTANITSYLLTCDFHIRFPTKPVLLHHVQLVYDRENLFAWNKTEAAAIPSLICYDHYLCEHLQPTLHFHNLSCRQSALMGFNSSSTYTSWNSIIDTIQPFFLGCMLSTQRKNKLQHPSLYCCQNSSKCISQHRVVDGFIDCPYHDDELAVKLSCSIKHTHRFRCHNEPQCRSPLFPTSVCPSQRFRDLKDISFREICDRIPHTFSIAIDGKNHTDETECEQWECSNIYTRCNKIWNCPDGKDEMNCTSSLSSCPAYTLECVSAKNYTIICLAKEYVGDGITDCLGGADEPSHCRHHIENESYYPGYLCFNETKCISPIHLCNKYPDCLFGDDELFCNRSHNICVKHMNPRPTDVEKSLCQLADGFWQYFSFDSLARFPRPKSYIISPTTLKMISPKTIQYITTDIDPAWYCHDGLAAIVRVNADLNISRCFCPPNFYGNRCQYQSDRVSVTLEVYPVRRHGIQSFFTSLVSYNEDKDQETIHSYHQSTYVLDDSCGKTFKFFLLYLSRPKNSSLKYFVKIDAFNQINLTYLASWRYHIPYSFLPVNPVAVAIRVPAEPVSLSSPCGLVCEHGRCMKYLNENEFFCQCDPKWSGKRCNHPLNCDDCALDALCVGSHENRSICMCSINTFGRRCLLKYSCPEDLCENDGRCVLTDATRSDENFGCLCSEKYQGSVCQTAKSILEISFKNMEIPSYILVDIFYSNQRKIGDGKPLMRMIAKKLRMFQESVTFYIGETFQIVIVEANRRYYLAVVEPSSLTKNMSTIITPEQECPSFEEVGDPGLSKLSLIRRVKYFHQLCRVRRHLMCFIDSYYFCLCTLERHANCLPFEPNFTCPENLYCLNNGHCFQNQPDCPSITFCICSDCFFGDRCQFYAKGIGLMLDDILRYELRSSMHFYQQSVPVKFSGGFAIVIFVIGVINSILSLMAFYSKASRKVGAGIYLFVSSINSLLTVCVLNAKVWFLIITQTQSSVSRQALRIGCAGLEPVLKLCLHMDSWLTACVAIERAMAVYKGVNFNKKLSKRIAYWVLILLPILIGGSFMHEFIFRNLYDDKEEERIWCVLEYSTKLNIYNTFIMTFHTMVPFLANLSSAVFIILKGTRRKKKCQNQQSYMNYFYKQLKEYQHLITSPTILTILSLPRVIISLLSGCVKENRNPWLYLSAYFISFIPAVVVFFVFVLPSPLYRQEFLKSRRLLKRRLSRLLFSPKF